MTSAKNFLINLALVLIAFGVAFAFGEGAARLFYKSETVLFPRYHTDYRYGQYVIRGIRPNAEFWHTSVDGSWKFTTNNRGFRNTRDFSYTKPESTLRVLSLGDSHTQGYEVHQERTYSAVLERHLIHHGLSAEVINAGVSGFSTAEALVFLENEGVKYNPDVVVLGFFANDFEDNLKTGLFSLDGERRLHADRFEHLPGVRIQNVIYSIPPVRWLGENSYFYSLLFNRVWVYFKEGLAERANQEAGGAQRGNLAGGELEFAVPTTGVRSAHEIALAAALLERMHNICKDKGIRFIIVDIPDRRGPSLHASSLPPQLAERLTKSGIELLSNQILFRDLNGAVDLFVPHGHGHVSELTHALIGVGVGRRLLPTTPGDAER